MNRRELLLKLVSIGIGSVLFGCDRKNNEITMNQKRPEIADFSGARFVKKLDLLVAAYEEKGMSVSESLLPGLAETDLREQCQWFPGDLTEEIISLYGWRGGQAKEAWEEKFPFWFRDNTFCSISRAKSEYESMMNSYGKYPKDHEMLKYSFPIASFNGAFYVLPTRGHNLSLEVPKPVISVHEGVDIYFYSVEKMIDTCIEWVSNERYTKEGLYPQELELEIWRKHNPGIFSG